MSTTIIPAKTTDLRSDAPDWLAITREKVESLRFGVVQIVVHDGRVTQIERTEKTRIPGQRDTAE